MGLPSWQLQSQRKLSQRQSCLFPDHWKSTSFGSNFSPTPGLMLQATKQLNQLELTFPSSLLFYSLVKPKIPSTLVKKILGFTNKK